MILANICDQAGAKIGADAVAELTFADEAALGAFFQIMQRPEVGAKIQEVEGEFTDGSKTSIVTVTETIVTEK